MGFEEHYSVRRLLVEALERDLVGPGAEDETIVDPPLTAYVSGVLYPRRSGTLEPSNDIDAADDEGEGAVLGADPPVALANVRYPSSMGLTFAVAEPDTRRITVRVRAARYEPIPVETPSPVDAVEPAGTTPEDFHHPRDFEPRRHWRRVVVPCTPVTVDIAVPDSGSYTDVAEGLRVYTRVRPADAAGAVPVTVVLLNGRTVAPNQGLGDADAFFQVGLEVRSDGDVPPFVERSVGEREERDPDIASTRLLYRHAHEFAVGHGCSVTWEPAASRPERAEVIRTTFVPEHEVLVAESNPAISVPSLAMRRLVDAPRDAVLQDFSALCAGYEDWIAMRGQEAALLPETQAEPAGRHLTACREALRRMQAGIRVLADDERAWEAFRLANAAMLRQRARTVWLRAGRPAGGPVEDDTHLWRPFQLAFMLLCLEGIVERGSADRNVADLLWFPTGGGKTEAYLGLIAFTVFLRRLRHGAGGDGVTALMRYTLRLLTLQQFERAGLLICCCEELRRADPRLGGEPISIGLWVGQDATPNTLEDAEKALDKLRAGLTPETGNPVQVHSCPWCGTPLDYRHYTVHKGHNRRLTIACRSADCAFSGGLPVYVVDEDVYRRRPTLVISTVDKFAGLPWREEAGALFNIGAGAATLPPELIVQDELHLISGPLGTLTGLYETAIDALCTDAAGRRPKVIASTATIRRAEDQTGGLFDRRVAQFPPPGLDARNSYFAVEASPTERGSRLYLGVSAPGTSHTTLLVRTYAALLQTIAEVDADDAIKDAYWTLVGYFNSLRVLGGATLQVQDDVRDRMELLATRNGTTARAIDERIELTSREASSKIPAHLAHMARSWPEIGALDVIFATNMISVGVDIDRLGLMAVMGQPQSTSEYIQATSRVGRSRPGLIVVLFNAARSRDRSHYESFKAYHAALYRQVESSSVTPFSPRARDRALHAVLVAMARLHIPALRPNEAAAQVAGYLPQLAEVKARIVDRVREVSPADAERTATELDELIAAWVARAAGYPRLRYRDYSNTHPALLVDAATDDATLEPGQFKTPWSLRDVDKESNLFVVG